jgi:hypothetical protein
VGSIVWGGDSFGSLSGVISYSPQQRVDYMSGHNGVLYWDALFTRTIHDWEMRFYRLFPAFSIPSKLIGMVKTGVRSLLARSGSFEIKSSRPLMPD